MSAEAMEVEPSGATEVVPAKSSPRSPHDILDETRAAMEDVAFRMLALKKDGGGGRAELRELVTQMSLLLITLRQVNRVILVEEERVKAETEAAKAPVDSTTLQLHNLLYEKNHYMKAIKACRDFQTKYPGIELVPDVEFARDAPEEIMTKALSADPQHDRMLKRLSFELLQRKELCKLHEKLEKRKSNLLDTMDSQKKFLSSLPSHLKSLKKASLPVQQQFGMPHTKKLKQHQAAELLPLPLYIAFSQLSAQKEAFGEQIEVEIRGSTKDAQSFIQKEIAKDNGRNKSDNYKMDDDAPDEEDDIQRRRLRSRNSVEETNDLADIYQVHPLRVTLNVYDDDETQTKSLKLISLSLEYLVKLNVVCVGVQDAEVTDDILCNLFPDDTGLDLPHQMSKIYSGDSVNFKERSSRPFKWAQHLAGIDFLPEVPQHRSVLTREASNNDVDVSCGLTLYRRQKRAQTILQRLRLRVKARIALEDQIKFLTKLQWPPLAHSGCPWATYTPTCRIDSWFSSGQDHSPSSALMLKEFSAVVDSELDRSVVAWEDMESTREDGELPVVIPSVENTVTNSKEINSDSSFDTLDHSKSLSLITKVTSFSNRSTALSHSIGRAEDDLDYMLDCESDSELITPETETEESFASEDTWGKHAEKEFRLVLSKRLMGDEVLKLEAKVIISMEYPLRPPHFSLMLLADASCGSRCYNDLRAMESEINLHVLEILPTTQESYTLAHQVRCMAMLFDLTFSGSNEKREDNAGTGESFSGMMLNRHVRGRDRRRTICWKGQLMA